jgi:hypothetical protein
MIDQTQLLHDVLYQYDELQVISSTPNDFFSFNWIATSHEVATFSPHRVIFKGLHWVGIRRSLYNEYPNNKQADAGT